MFTSRSMLSLALLLCPMTGCTRAQAGEPTHGDQLAQASSSDSEQCKRGCNSQCHGAKNKSKCVAECRRACDR